MRVVDGSRVAKSWIFVDGNFFLVGLQSSKFADLRVKIDMSLSISQPKNNLVDGRAPCTPTHRCFPNIKCFNLGQISGIIEVEMALGVLEPLPNSSANKQKPAIRTKAHFIARKPIS